MSYWEVMRLPIKVFWLMSDSVNRLMAEKDLRSMTVATSIQEGSVGEVRENLVLELGEVVVGSFDPLAAERDPDATSRLKALSML